MNRSAQKQVAPEFRTMNADLFTLTYGALVMDVIRDRESPKEVNRELDKIGYNMGLRMADDFLAKNPRVGRCSNMQQLSEVLAKSACKMYLGVQVGCLCCQQDTSYFRRTSPTTRKTNFNFSLSLIRLQSLWRSQKNRRMSDILRSVSSLCALCLKFHLNISGDLRHDSRSSPGNEHRSDDNDDK